MSCGSSEIFSSPVWDEDPRTASAVQSDSEQAPLFSIQGELYVVSWHPAAVSNVPEDSLKICGINFGGACLGQFEQSVIFCSCKVSAIVPGGAFYRASGIFQMYCLNRIIRVILEFELLEEQGGWSVSPLDKTLQVWYTV